MPNMCLANWAFSSRIKLWPPNVFKVVFLQFVIRQINWFLFTFLIELRHVKIWYDLFWRNLWSCKYQEVSMWSHICLNSKEEFAESSYKLEVQDSVWKTKMITPVNEIVIWKEYKVLKPVLSAEHGISGSIF